VDHEKANGEPGREEISRRKLVSFLGAIAGSTTLASCVTDRGPGEAVPVGKATRAIVTIEGGVPPSNHPNLDAALAASAAAPVTLVIDKPIEITQTSIEIPAHVTLRFQDAGQLVVPPGKQVVLSGPVEAPASPGYPLFKVGGFPLDGGTTRGSVVPNHEGTEYYANWWSDDAGRAGGYGEPNTADLAGQWNNMVRDAVKSGNGVKAKHFAVAGCRVLSSMMDVRDFQADQHLDFSGSLIRVDMPDGGVAVNFTNSSRLRITRLSLHSTGNVTSVNGPHVGVLLARALLPSGPGNHDGSLTFEGLLIGGVWRVAALYNVDSRNNVFIGGLLENIGASSAVGSYVAFFGRHLADAVFPTPPATGSLPLDSPVAGTGSGQTLLATRLMGNVTRATLCVRGFDCLSARAIYTYSVGSQQSHVEIDGSDNSGMTGVQIDDIYGEGTPRYGLKIFSSEDGNRIGNIAFTTRNLETSSSNSTDRSVYIDARLLDACTFTVRGSSKPFECVSKVWLRDTSITIPDVIDASTPLLILGNTFTGRIAIGDTALIDTSATTGSYNAEIMSRGGSSPRLQYHLPLSIKARCPAEIPAPPDGEAILWMNKGDGNIYARIGTASGHVTKKLVTWVNAPGTPPDC
jgi:hypothetical protein